MTGPHRKQVKHYHQPGDIHEFTFSTYCRRPILTNSSTRCYRESHRSRGSFGLALDPLAVWVPWSSSLIVAAESCQNVPWAAVANPDVYHFWHWQASGTREEVITTLPVPPRRDMVSVI